MLMVLDEMTRAEDAAARRCLIMSDCEAAMRKIERAWRARRRREYARGACGAMLCTCRERLETVVFMYVPAHRGFGANAAADAVAKTSTALHDDGGVDRTDAARARSLARGPRMSFASAVVAISDPFIYSSFINLTFTTVVTNRTSFMMLHPGRSMPLRRIGRPRPAGRPPRSEPLRPHPHTDLQPATHELTVRHSGKSKQAQTLYCLLTYSAS